jgi:nitroreductase
MIINDGLKWRYAAKRYDTSRIVSDEHIELLKESVNLTASSYGLQPYKVLVITDPVIRKQLSEAAWGQAQVTEASHLFLFCNYLEVGDNEVDEYLRLRADINNLDIEESREYGNIMKLQMKAMSEEQMKEWTSKQTYIALGTLLAATAELRIDSSPMEGFNKTRFDEILGLNERGLTSSVMAAIGYRDPSDPFGSLKKVRKPLNDLFEEL